MLGTVWCPGLSPDLLPSPLVSRSREGGWRDHVHIHSDPLGGLKLVHCRRQVLPETWTIHPSHGLGAGQEDLCLGVRKMQCHTAPLALHDLGDMMPESVPGAGVLLGQGPGQDWQPNAGVRHPHLCPRGLLRRSRLAGR